MYDKLDRAVLDLTFGMLPVSSKKTLKSESPFRGIEQTGVLSICPLKSPQIAWARTKAALDTDDGIKVAIPFRDHVRYYSVK